MGLTLSWFHMAAAIRIASVAAAAGAGGQVIGDTAIGIVAAGARAGIAALLLLTRPVRGTVRIAYAFGSARLIGISEIVGQALTRSNAIALAANGIRSAGIRFTGRYLLVHYALCGVIREGFEGRERYGELFIIVFVSVEGFSRSEHT